MCWCKCPGVPRRKPPGMATDKCIRYIFPLSEVHPPSPASRAFSYGIYALYRVRKVKQKDVKEALFAGCEVI